MYNIYNIYNTYGLIIRVVLYVKCMSVVSYSPTDHRQTVLIGRSTCPRGGATVGSFIKQNTTEPNASRRIDDSYRIMQCRVLQFTRMNHACWRIDNSFRKI